MKKGFVRAFSMVIALALILCSAPLSGIVPSVAAAGVVLDGEKLVDDTGVAIPGLGTDTYKWVLYSDGNLYINEDVASPAWLSNAINIKNVVVSSSVETILPRSFYQCINLTAVSLGMNVSEIGAHAFDGCAKLTAVTIPLMTETLGDYAFYNCTALSSATVGASVANVGENVFKGCTALQNVTINSGCTRIGYGMFCDCSALASIALPDSITDIGAHAFDNCTSLTSVTIPDSVTDVGDYAFYNCQNLASAVIGHKLSTVGEYVFGRCGKLASVTIKSGANCIGDWMFYNCESLATLPNLPESITEIKPHAFEGCTALTGIVLPNTTISIGDNAFYGCSAMTSIALNSALQSIGKFAFYGTKITALSVPANVTTIGSGAFSSCSELANISVTGTNPAYRSANGILFDASLTKVLCCPAGKTGELVLASSTTAIDSYAFNDCTKLTKITIPSSVTTIASTAFNGCASTLVIVADCVGAAATYANTYNFTLEKIHKSAPEWVIVSEPTCEVNGTKEERCPDCGEVFATGRVDVLGHNYIGTVTKPATCEEDGVLTYICEHNDAHRYTEVIPKLGHNFDNGVVTKEATCERDGVLTYTCQNDSHHTYTEVIPMLGHVYDNGTVTKEATCEADGILTYTCLNDARHTYTEVIPKLGHVYDNGTVTKEATCEGEGVMTYTCLNDSRHVITQVIPALGHDYDDGVATVPATCTTPGVMTYTCRNDASHTYTETIAATGHHFDYENGVITKKNNCKDGEITYTCPDCGETETVVLPAKHFIRTDWVVDVPATCTTDGEKSHRCAVCGIRTDITVIPKTGHHYVNGVCKDCGEYDGVTVLLSAPELLSTKCYGRGIIVTWKPVSGATGYNIYRKTAGSKWKKIAVADGALRDSCVDEKAANGVAYTYTVRAFNDNYISDFDAAGITETFLTSPKLVSVRNTGKGVVFSWAENTEAEGYIVYRKTTGGWKAIAKLVGCNRTSYQDTNVKSGNSYTYTVRAYSDTSKSSYYSGINAMFLTSPKLVKAISVSNGITVQWGGSQGASGYAVYRKTVGDNWKRIAVVKGGSKRSYTDTTAKKGVKYTYTVRAMNGSYLSSYYQGISKTR